MTLFPICETKITLPDLIIHNRRIGDNKVIRYGFKSKVVKIEIYDSDINGLYLLRTELPSPYNDIYLRRPHTRPIIPPNVLCLESKGVFRPDNINETTRFKWSHHYLITDERTPEGIVKSWDGLFQFKQESPADHKKGLRLPQLGALHSVCSHLTMDLPSEPVTVVLPTGTGKTEVMLAALFFQKIKKLLVLVPSDNLRDQLSDKFFNFGQLSALNIIPFEVALPNVAIIKRGIKSIEEADGLLNYSNVFIATASILKEGNQDAVGRLCNGCTHLFIDEAHHIAAATWMSIRNKFLGKHIIQFTATPFRNDGAALGGRIIYNYTICEAQKANYFRHINYVPIEEYDNSDYYIAQKAIEVLRKDLDAGYDHLLMARVEKKKRAEKIITIYRKLAPDLNPIVIHSNLSQSEIKARLNELCSKRSRIVICVKMLGEGFDLPNLKIAAIHDIHKSLAITLQFIGRFTRNANNVENASVIVNVAEPEVESGLQKLYAQSADWDNFLHRLSENRIKREIRLQEVIDGLKQKGNLHNQLSLWNMRPSFSAMLFKTSCDNWCPEEYEKVFSNHDNHWFAISDTERLLVILALDNSPVRWGSYKDLSDNVYKLLIAFWDAGRNALFIYSNDYQWFRVIEMAKIICKNSIDLVSGPQIFNIFNKVEYPLVKNLGASKIGAISFTQYFGPNVTEGLSSIEASESNLSNMAGLGYEEGKRVIWGCAQKKGKIWSVNSGSISDWCEWVQKAWDKVIDGEVDESNISRNFLRPVRIQNFYSEHILSVQWGEYTLSEPEDKVVIMFGEKEVPFYLVDLKIQEVQNNSYLISISGDDMETVYKFSIDSSLSGGFEYKLHNGAPISIRRGSGAPKILSEYLVMDPWVIHYVDGSFSYNCYLIKVSQDIGQYNMDEIETWDWSGIKINKESMGPSMQTDTVQYRAYEAIHSQYDLIINDDGKGEAADLVCMKILDEKILLGLVHCKYSGSESPGNRVNDLYELCGQAQKSIHWKHAGISHLANHLRNREKRWNEQGNTRFLKGSMHDLIHIARRSRTSGIKFQIQIVQPGLKKSTVTAEMLRVLGSTSLYLTKTSQGVLSVVGSE